MAGDGILLQALGSPFQCRLDYIPTLQCPALSHEHSPFYDNEFLGKRSTCPWVMCRDSDPHRLPRDIYYAKCLCTGCKGQSGEYSCQPIFTSRIVSRVTNRSTHDEIVRVPTGCTCAKNRWRLLINKNKLRKKFCRKNVQLCKLRTIYLWSGITIDTISMSFSTQMKASNCSFPETFIEWIDYKTSE